ncbi:MAG: ImmA/IrrE family metallo-endopeptidase, partial [Ignavibacteria bacterium]|nr:ImmA/IrrE family metallo-endopeptidase [Ignavibacteria bacterium]
MGMGPKEFALRSGKPEKTITAILKGDSSITPDMAVIFESVTNIPAHFWMNHQRSYDEYIAREKRKNVIEQSVAWAKSFPLADMIKKGWLPRLETIQEKTFALLSFFGFSNHIAWEEYYLKQKLKVAYRISLANSSEPFAISAWLRKGELQAASMSANQYSEKNFKDALPNIKTIMATHPDDFFLQLQNICLEAGVKVVHTPCLPKAPISGSTRWINDTPFIQLSGRYKRNDIFWFTFFHEAGHILLHGKKDIFLEAVQYADKDVSKEKEADDFAAKWLLTAEQEEIIMNARPFTPPIIRHFATKFNTHPAIIVGRLQHKKLVPYSFGTEYVKSIEFD